MHEKGNLHCIGQERYRHQVFTRHTYHYAAMSLCVSFVALFHPLCAAVVKMYWMWCFAIVMFSSPLYGILSHGVDLPSTISEGYTAVVNAAVPSAGTSLDVSSMLGNGIGNGSALFRADGLVFAGTLAINCPQLATAYSIPLLVIIVNGTTHAAMSASSHVKISGVLAGGSRVSILGGSYTFVNSDPSFYFEVTAALTIEGASALEIVGGSFTVPPSFTVGGTNAMMYAAFSTTITHNSTMSIRGITIGVYNVNLAADWIFRVLLSSSPIAIANHSDLSICGSTVEVRSTNMNKKWRFYVLFAPSPVALTGSSTLTIHDTSIGVFDVNVGSDWGMYVLYAASLDIGDGSALSLVGVDAVVRGLTVMGASSVSVVNGGFTVSGAMLLRNAILKGASAKWIEATSLIGLGHVSVVNVATIGVGNMVSMPQATSDTPKFHVCRNSVNNVSCNIAPSGDYPCATSISQHAEGCSGSLSRSSSGLITHLTVTATTTGHITATTPTSMSRSLSALAVVSATFTSMNTCSTTPTQRQTASSSFGATTSNSVTLHHETGSTTLTKLEFVSLSSSRYDKSTTSTTTSTESHPPSTSLPTQSSASLTLPSYYSATRPTPTHIPFAPRS